MRHRFPLFRTLFVAALALAPLSAQFDSIATDATASRVWFSTSRLLRPDSRNSQERIYEAATPLPLLASISPISVEVASLRPQASDDGNILAWTVRQRNLGEGGEALPYLYRGVIRRASDDKTWVIPAEGRLSRNGRWFVAASTLFDLSQNPGTDLIPTTTYVTPGVADDGTFLDNQNGELVLRRPGGVTTTLPSSFRFGGTQMDRTASVLVTTESTGLPEDAGARARQNILLFRTATGVTTKILSRCTQCELLSISGDGAKLLFSAYWPNAASPAQGWRQLYLLDLLTGDVRRLTNEPADVSTGALSSNGFQVCHGSAAGELRCLDTAGGPARVLVGAISDVRLDGRFYVPGSRSVLPGVGLQNITIRLAGTDLPLLAGSSTQAQFVLPFTADPGNVTLEVDQPVSVFAPQQVLLPVLAAKPEFVTLSQLGGPPDPSSDWPFLENGTRGGLASAFDPVRRGEDLWIHMTGLGRNPAALNWTWGGAPILPTAVEYEEYNPGWHVAKFRIPQDGPTGPVALSVKADGQDAQTILVQVSGN